MARNGGFTLVEVLVASVLTAMLVTSMYRLLLGGARIFQKVQVHSELQDEGLVGLSHLATELHAGSWRTLSIRDAAISFQLSTGGFVVYYLDGATHRLLRGVTRIPGATRVDPQVAIQSGLTQPSVVAQHVESFTLTPAAFPNNTPADHAIQATLQLATATGSTVTRETVTIASAPRN